MSHVTNQHWDEKKKIEVVTTYLAVGKYPLVEAITGVPSATIQTWKRQPWWPELVHEIQNESDQELDSKLHNIVDKSLDVVLDRIENGDFVLNSKTGQVTRVPIKIRDAHKVSVELIDKRDLIRNRERVKVEVQAVDVYLKKIADQFAEFVKRKLPKTYEGEIVAIHEGRQEGLQEGVPEVPLPTGTN
jgi:hypothetical protein